MKPEEAKPQTVRGLGFDNDFYLKNQINAFQNRIESMPDAALIIEFGGKPFGDHHAARVLPGYHIDNKAIIIRHLQQECNSKIAMVVNARDIFHPPEGRTLRGRVRGDSGLRYDFETIRLIKEANDLHDIKIDSVVIAVMPRSISDFNSVRIVQFSEELYSQIGMEASVCYEIPEYPDVSCLESEKIKEVFIDNDTITDPGRNLTLISPGGGSGKFGVAISEIYNKLTLGEPVAFVKFETFPIFKLAFDHPLNLAFIAATVDLGNKLVSLEQGTNYDKDSENFKLLNELVRRLPDRKGYMSDMKSQFDFSINVIETGITDEGIVFRAAFHEIEDRLIRYRKEYISGDEKLSTVTETAKIAGQCAVYLSRYFAKSTD